jgi:exopolyphosphatase/guanosine-5'-triphosphate,3'-diphosphate pyrophosphatase
MSIDIGCVRMLEKFLHSDPPTEEELHRMREHVDAELARVKDALEPPLGVRLIGVAGTVTQLATLKAGLPVYDPDVTHHAVLSHGDVRRLARRLGSLPYTQRKRVKALDPGRVDVIVPGAHILLLVMEAFDAAEVLVSEKDILDGLVIELFDE